MENDNQEPTEVSYNLKNRFDFAAKGEIAKAEFMTLHPPTMQCHPLAATLKQSIYRILKDIAVNETDQEGKEEDKREDKQEDVADKIEDDEKKREQQIDDIKSIINVVYTSPEIRSTAIWEQAKKLFVSGVVLINGEQKLSMPLINKMSIHDFEQMTGMYIINFTVA